MEPVEIGIIGGTGFYEFLPKGQVLEVNTPYGYPSAPLKVGELQGIRVAFIPRHGTKHQYPSHMVPYRANMWALRSIGVRRVLAPCAVGSLKPEVRPGDIVFCDQFVNFTRERKDTFYDGPDTTHISTADPYCPELTAIAVKLAQEVGISFHGGGAVVVIQGPRFSTRAESSFFRTFGSVINMTQYPECVLARELEICYLNISLVTDYDVGLENDPNIAPVSHAEVKRVFSENLEKLKLLLGRMVPLIPRGRSCICSKALADARLKA